MVPSSGPKGQAKVVSGLLASTSVVPSLQAVEETFPKLLRGYASNFRTSDTAHFLEQLKGECHFSNGHVRSVTRYVYNREEFVHFDSDVGEFRAVTELGKPIAKELNSEKDVLDNYRASVDRCRNDYALVDILLLNQRVEPKVTVYPTKTQPLQHHNLMVCSVSGFYPGQIEVRWFQNGQEEEVGVVSTGLIKNGDWTFQILVMLETVPESGEVYTCQVEHPSLKNPVTVEWNGHPAQCLGPYKCKIRLPHTWKCLVCRGPVWICTEQDVEWSRGLCARSALPWGRAVHLLQEPQRIFWTSANRTPELK
uniref:H-2 class II histocompatibility antigen, E-S beta chain-like n=1 Tax=Castor canadensis TaxID=51338 RepID=A0A8B7TPB8_CASCN|nr:H-2 class II histocompatibility antigen, E-S beta chain-like [Castor canadensis]